MQTTLKELIISELGIPLESLKENKMVDIADSKIGVKAYNENTNTIEYAKVIGVVKKPVMDMYRLQLENGETTEPMAGRHWVATHPQAKGLHYEYVEDLKVGDTIITIDGTTKVTDIFKVDQEAAYDISTSLGNYFTGSVLSHNTMGSNAIKFTGGSSMEYYPSTRFRVRKIENIEKNGEVVGIKMRVRNMKNKAGIPFREADLDLYYDGGFDVSGEFFEFLFKLGIFIQGGAWYTNRDDPSLKFNGRAKVKEWCDANPDKYEEYKKEIIQRLLGYDDMLDSGNHEEEDDITDEKIKKARKELAEETGVNLDEAANDNKEG